MKVFVFNEKTSDSTKIKTIKEMAMFALVVEFELFDFPDSLI